MRTSCVAVVIGIGGAMRLEYGSLTCESTMELPRAYAASPLCAAMAMKMCTLSTIFACAPIAMPCSTRSTTLCTEHMKQLLCMHATSPLHPCTMHCKRLPYSHHTANEPCSGRAACK